MTKIGSVEGFQVKVAFGLASSWSPSRITIVYYTNREKTVKYDN